jgi:DNA-binding NtrC family response regulator
MKRVLIMEDNISLAIEWTNAFELNNCQVSLSSNVAEAILFLETEPFDLLVTDLFVDEGENGLQLISHISKTANHAVPIIAVTGAKLAKLDKNIFLETARIFGAASVIQKPFPAGELLLAAHDLWEKNTPAPSIS